NPSALVHRHDGRSLPGDLALIERGKLAAALRLGLPVEEQPRGALLFSVRRRAPERLERERERVRTENRFVFGVDGLQLRRRLVPGVRKVKLARDLVHEVFALGTKPVQRQRSHQLASRSRTIVATFSAATRCCCNVSRSRMVTVPSLIVSPSTVMQYGVPTSS